jgi:plastocyanin
MKPALVLALSLFAALAPSTRAQVTVDIHIFNFGFGTAGGVSENPTIQVGDTVHWIWDTTTSHSTTSAAGQAESWNSGVMSTPGATFDHTFENIGTFNYYCLIHGADIGGGQVSGMSGSITVVPEPGTWGAAVGFCLVAFAIFRARPGQGKAVRSTR